MMVGGAGRLWDKGSELARVSVTRRFRERVWGERTQHWLG